MLAETWQGCSAAVPLCPESRLWEGAGRSSPTRRVRSATNHFEDTSIEKSSIGFRKERLLAAPGLSQEQPQAEVRSTAYPLMILCFSEGTDQEGENRDTYRR